MSGYDGAAQPGTHGNAALASGNSIVSAGFGLDDLDLQTIEFDPMHTLLIHNAHTIATQDDARTELRNASVFICDNTIAFIGPLRDPVRNRWVVEFGIISCLLVLPLALIMGPIRDIPFFHRLIDCAFGVVGIVPLWWCRRAILRLERAATNQPTV